MSRVVVIFVLIFASVRCVEILKCCPNGKNLTKEFSCHEDGPANFQPVYYSPATGRLLDPFTVLPNFTFVENTLPHCERERYLYLGEQVHLPVMVPSGFLYVNYDRDELIFPAGDYCLSPKGSVVCLDAERVQKRLKTEKNIHKCCLVNAEYSEKKGGCVPRRSANTTPSFLAEDTFIHVGFPQCASQEEFSILGILFEGYSLNADGTLRTSTGHSLVNHCVEYIYEYDDEKARVFTCAPAAKVLDVAGDDVRLTLFPIGFFVSVFFLAVTLVSTFMLPGSYHALHWKCQTHYIICLLIGDLLLGATQISTEFLKDTHFCAINATVVHFFFLAAFFWLNTMCFNIWWTFRDLRPSVDKGQETYRLALYRLYAWGIPLIIVGIGSLMDHVLTDTYPAILRPRFGEMRCWFYGDSELFVYFLGPVGLLLIINLILFVATTRELTCGLWKREGVKSTTERTALSHICLKLVIVMGITWIVDLLSWTIGGPHYVWYLTDLVNALQGVFIFIVVGCQPQVWNAVKRKWFSTDSSSRNIVSSNATPSVINDQPSTKQTVETLC